MTAVLEPDAPVVTTSATTQPDAAPTPAEEPVDARPRRPWFSGFCGPGPECNDERLANKAGEVVRHCLYEAENGEKVLPRRLYCACACHQDPARAGQAVEAA